MPAATAPTPSPPTHLTPGGAPSATARVMASGLHLPFGQPSVAVTQPRAWPRGRLRSDAADTAKGLGKGWDKHGPAESQVCQEKKEKRDSNKKQKRGRAARRIKNFVQFVVRQCKSSRWGRSTSLLHERNQSKQGRFESHSKASLVLHQRGPADTTPRHVPSHLHTGHMPLSTGLEALPVGGAPRSAPSAPRWG